MLTKDAIKTKINHLDVKCNNNDDILTHITIAYFFKFGINHL